MKPRLSMLGVAGALTLSTLACAAPRDPELEKQVLAAARVRDEAPSGEAPSAPPPPRPERAARPVKTYSGSEIANILGSVGGTGVGLVAVFTTQRGTLSCRLDERAPQSVANFVGLATGQLDWQPEPSDAPRRRPFYEGLTFHRIVQGFVIQTGNPTGRTNAGPGWRIARERGANDLFLEAGAIAMIEDGDQSHGSQLFITAKGDKSLGATYSAFGRCQPVELVAAIANAEKLPGSDGKQATVPVTISAVRVERTP